MSGAVLELKDVTRIIPGAVPVTLVDGASISFAAGDFVSITGPSGSGKSSLLYLLGLLDRPSTGEVLLHGGATALLASDELAALRLAGLGFVFQFHFLLAEFTVLENVLLPMRRLSDRSHSAMEDRAQGLLDRLGLATKFDRTPDQLSGGERQRVAVARALANDPDIVLADEPTGNLDSHNARIVFDIFADLARSEGKTVIIVTHEKDLADETDIRVEMLDGKIVSQAVQHP
ncbi:MAG: lipoprotein-releasing system ATP-binding protein [Alphaproteobacteria bacterium]|jgi:lipoprotein-releasing system ATP-binding protein